MQLLSGRGHVDYTDDDDDDDEDEDEDDDDRRA
jgi:hypothetical protein